MEKLLLTYYGDDFTGSTDALEALSLGGVPTVLFLRPPSADLLAERFADVQAVGLAGMSRALAPDEMDATLPDAFESLKALGAPICHYKVCSTFDSSPTVGNIGRAAEIGRNAFNAPSIPVVVGAPRLRRYVLFGNLFATMGDTTYRIDRHPTMSRHPVTPMHESDLRRHLAAQTKLTSALVDLFALETAPQAALAQAIEAGAELIIFDTRTSAHLATVGDLLAAGDAPFVVGSSGVEDALVAHWQAAGVVADSAEFPPLDPVDKLLVISGSASPVSAEQIRVAGEHGFALLRLDVRGLVESADAQSVVVAQAKQLLDSGKSVVLYSAMGPEDDGLLQDGMSPANWRFGRKLAAAQGRIARGLIEQTDLTRLCIAGGDTCSGAVQQLDIFALQMYTPVAPGAPLCRTHSHSMRWDGLQIALKGGQVGQADFFVRLLG